MDAKITLSFNADVITKAKVFAETNKVSLSRITEILWAKMMDTNSKTIDALPVSDWVTELVGKDPVYVTKQASEKMYDEYYESRFNIGMVAEDITPYEKPKKQK
jgi:hypothetical protein